MPPRTRAKATTPGKEAPAPVVEEKKKEEPEPEVVEEPEVNEDEDVKEEDDDEKEEIDDADDNAENGDEDDKGDDKADEDADETKEGEDGSQDKADGDNEESKDKTEEEKKVKIPIELDEKAKTWVVVVVGLVTYADFGLTELKLPLLKCNSFETRFFQEDDTKKGFVTMFFSKSWDAYVAVDKLRELEVPREGDKTSNYTCWLLDKTQTHSLMRQDEITLKQLKTDLNATNDQDPSLRSLFVANIPKSATKDLLTAIFAEAQDIVLPLAEPGKNKGYCYIEFSEGGEKLDEYLTKYQDIKIEDGEVSAKIIIRKIGNSVTDKGKERASRMLKARAKQQIPDLGKKSSVDSRKPRDGGGKGNYRGSPYRGGGGGSRFPRNERYDNRQRNYGNQYYGRGGGPRDDRRDSGAAALAAIQQLLAKPMGMGRGRGRGGGGSGGGGGGGSSSSGGFRRGTKRRFPAGFDDYGGDYGMAKVARRYDGPMGMEGPSSHFYEDQYDSGWGGSSFSQGYGGGSSGYMGGGGGGYGGGSGGNLNDRRRKNFRGGKFNKRN